MCALFDLGVYDLTALTRLLGPAKRVTAMAGVCVPERTVVGKQIRVEAADSIHLILDFGDSIFASLVTGFTIQRQRGSEGVIQMRGHAWAPDGYELWQNQAGCWQTYCETQPGWPWTAGLDHFVECIRTGGRPIASSQVTRTRPKSPT